MTTFFHPYWIEGTLDTTNSRPRSKSKTGNGFTLIELLVVIAIIGLLAAMLLPALARAKAQGQSASCKNLLRQMSVALQVYADNNRQEYPLYSDPTWEDSSGFRASLGWFDKLYPPNGRAGSDYRNLWRQWTNVLFHCPTYLAEGGMLFSSLDAEPLGSYSYNWFGTGIVGDAGTSLDGGGFLGIGQNGIGSGPPTHDYQVVAPSEFFAMADARPGDYFFQNSGYGFPTNSWFGDDLMQIWAITDIGSFGANGSLPSKELLPPPHAQGYNIAYGDGHVGLVSRRRYLYPPLAASHWNRDNQTYLDALNMIPRSHWSVTQ